MTVISVTVVSAVRSGRGPARRPAVALVFAVLAGLALAACETAPKSTPERAEAAPPTAPAPDAAPKADEPRVPSASVSRSSGAGLVGPVISQDAVDFIIEQEVGGRSVYEGRLGQKPHWDGAGSGILIGFGYNLGSASEAAFRRDWGGVLAPAALDRLAATVGVRPQGADRAADAATMRALVAAVSDIQIPWEDAKAVFETAMIPDYVRRVRRSLKNTDLLHPHSMGALVSLVFNRGATFGRSGTRYAEMRAIRNLMAAKTFDSIPEQLRAMAALWPTIRHLQNRRRAEADLFQRGLDAQAAAR